MAKTFNKYLFLIIILIPLINVSCVPLKNLNYFNDINNIQEPSINPRDVKLIMPFDKLYIKVLSIDDKTNQLFSSSDNVSMGSFSDVIGNIVDKDGNITYPVAGKIHVTGLTTNQAATKIEEALKDYVPVTQVIVKYIDNNVTLLGEVQRQGRYSFTHEKITIYDALALGGGLTRYGNRKKVILIRQEGDKILHHRLDLSDSKISDKEYYYIIPNDIIIIEPLKSISSSYGNSTVSIILSSVSVLISILIFSGVGN